LSSAITRCGIDFDARTLCGSPLPHSFARSRAAIDAKGAHNLELPFRVVASSKEAYSSSPSSPLPLRALLERSKPASTISRAFGAGFFGAGFGAALGAAAFFGAGAFFAGAGFFAGAFFAGAFFAGAFFAAGFFAAFFAAAGFFAAGFFAAGFFVAFFAAMVVSFAERDCDAHHVSTNGPQHIEPRRK
jgi:hypothetical protein